MQDSLRDNELDGNFYDFNFQLMIVLEKLYKTINIQPRKFVDCI